MGNHSLLPWTTKQFAISSSHTRSELTLQTHYGKAQKQNLNRNLNQTSCQQPALQVRSQGGFFLLLRKCSTQACPTCSPLAACSPAQLTLWPPLPYPVMAAVPPAKQPGLAPQHNPNFGVLLTLPGLKPGQSAVITQPTANRFMHFDTLAMHSPVNSRKYVAVLSILIKQFEKNFQDGWKKSSIFHFICNAIFGRLKYITSEFSNWMWKVVIKNLIVFLYQIFISPS